MRISCDRLKVCCAPGTVEIDSTTSRVRLIVSAPFGFSWQGIAGPKMAGRMKLEGAISRMSSHDGRSDCALAVRCEP